MNTTESAVCARDGCRFHVELVLVADMPLPATHCGAACADYEWLRRGLEEMDQTPDVDALYENLRGFADVLNERTEPLDIDYLLYDVAGDQQ